MFGAPCIWLLISRSRHEVLQHVGAWLRRAAGKADLTFYFNFNLAHEDIRIGALNANTDAGGHERRSAISDPAIAAIS